jgi:methylenetetrahydrofolate reductase (NADPH)
MSFITDLLHRRSANQKPTLSFEFYPPKNDEGASALDKAFDDLMHLEPDFVSVTYGAGGSNRERSIAVVEKFAPQIATIGHLTCVGATKQSTAEVIEAFEQAGVAAILAIRGDNPADEPDALSAGELSQAIELVQLSKSQSDLSVGVAAFPEKHPESPDLEHDVRVLKLKQDAGADFAVTQLFFSVTDYINLVDAARASGVTLPILPGLMPISNAKNVLRMAELSGARLPVDLHKALVDAPNEDAAREIGMSYTISLGIELLEAGAPGLHIFALNQSAAAERVAKGVDLAR